MKTLTLVLGVVSALAPISAFAGTSSGDYNTAVITVPEPATLGLMAVGVAGAVIASRFRKKK
jgi:hypothetical protein